MDVNIRLELDNQIDWASIIFGWARTGPWINPYFETSFGAPHVHVACCMSIYVLSVKQCSTARGHFNLREYLGPIKGMTTNGGSRELRESKVWIQIKYPALGFWSSKLNEIHSWVISCPKHCKIMILEKKCSESVTSVTRLMWRDWFDYRSMN